MTKTTNEKICLAARYCSAAGGDICNNSCATFIALHGFSGEGGRVAAAGIPKKYARVSLTTSPARSTEAAIYNALDEYIKTFKRQFSDEAIKGLYLYSPKTGNGKTTTAAAIGNEFLVRHVAGSAKRGLQPRDNVVYFLDVNEWQTLYNQFNRPNVPRETAERAAAEYYRRESLARTAAYAIFDDIGVRECSTGFRGDLHSLLNYRNVREMPSVYTSNVPLEELPHVFGESRLADRIRELTIQLTFTGQSQRGRK